MADRSSDDSAGFDLDVDVAASQIFFQETDGEPILIEDEGDIIMALSAMDSKVEEENEEEEEEDDEDDEDEDEEDTDEDEEKTGAEEQTDDSEEHEEEERGANRQVPKTEAQWRDVAKEFGNKWNFPNCVGAIDGKHIRIKKPMNSGSHYHNYKGYCSVVLMAVVDANYRFLSVDVGFNGRISDGGVIRHTKFWDLFENGSLNIPDPDFIPSSTEKFPFVFVMDDAFALQTNFMKPYSMNGLDSMKLSFNYRLSRARRVVENAFGILVSKFGIFQKDINLDPSKVNIITMACCLLHNYLLKENPTCYLHGMVDVEEHTTGNISEGADRASIELLHLKRGRFQNASTTAKEIREKFATYFANEGKVPWQDNVIS